MKTKYIYFGVAAIAIAAVVYPVAYAAITNNSGLNNPYQCTPLIPCQGPNPGFESCVTACTIYMANSTFIPGTVNVSIGARVTWINLDGFSHTATAYNATTWDTGFIGPGKSMTVVFTSKFAPGTYYYHCNVHPQMIGLINVVS